MNAHPTASNFELGFELGFDLYRYKANYLMTVTDNPNVLTGYEAAAMQNTSQRSSSKYERKWLSIRLRCLNKDRAVTITPVDLANALDNTKGHCPVTGDELTFGTGELTDWSIDRVDNDKPYTPDNIIVISSRANQAKGDLNLTQMLLSMNEYRQKDSIYADRHELLSLMQWYHMISVFYNKLPLDSSVNFSHEIAKNSPDTMAILVSNPLFVCKGDNGFTDALVTQRVVAKDTLVRAKKLFRKRFVKSYRATGEENDDPRHVLTTTPKLASFVSQVIAKVRECHILDRALFEDLMSNMVPAKEAKKIAPAQHRNW